MRNSATLGSIFLLLVASPVSGQILINELLPNPTGDDVGTERVEIVNAGPTAIDVTGWAIDDAATIDMVSVRCRLPEDFDTALCPGSAIIGPGEFRVVKGMSTAAWLNNAGDDVYLVTDRTLSPPVVDVVTYPSASTQVDMTWAAIPNGSENFAFRTATLCGSNGGASDFIPPSTVSDLAAAPGGFPGEVRLTWTAPGDDGAIGTASAYEMKVSLSSINSGNFAAATDLETWTNEPLPKPAGAAETLFVFGLAPSTTYFFALEAIDDAANVGGVSNSPSVAALAGALLDPDLGYSVYYGNLHSHTGYSDGVQTPAAAYTFARNTAPTPLDFLAVTDHNHSGAGMSLPSYSQGLSEAAAANDDGNFVAIYGQEWGLSSGGHVNIFESPALFGWESSNYDVFVGQTDYPGLYAAALANPPASYPPIALWCHPALGDFNSLQATTDGKALVHLMCLVNGPYNSTALDESDVGNTGFDGAFQQALRNGMRVSPTADQDNHNATWGASTESRTAVFANARTKSAILGGLAASRNYATQDHNVRADFSCDGHAMGEAFTSAAGVRIAVSVTDADSGDSASLIELFRGVTGVSTAARVAWNSNSADFQWRERDSFSAGTEVHYYLRIRMSNNASVWTGPVYVTYNAATAVASVDGADGVVANAGRFLLAPPRPNPARGPATIGFALPSAGGSARLAIFDATGRLVRTLLDRAVAPGEQTLVWDGLASNGVLAPAGVYFVRLESAGASISRKLLLVR